jgi:hypothetical protein
MKEYMIITSISIIDENYQKIPCDEDIIIHQEKGINNFYCKWFSEKEAYELRDNELVPGIKELFPRALKLYEFNTTDLESDKI